MYAPYRVANEVARQFAARAADQTLPAPETSVPAMPPEPASRFQAPILEHLPDQAHGRHTSGMDPARREGNICLANSGIGGNTAFFTSAAVSHLLEHPQAVTLAIYPDHSSLVSHAAEWARRLENTAVQPVLIHYGLDESARVERMHGARIVLMTPHLLHGWALAHLAEPAIGAFLSRLELLILGEARAYAGMFGTNLAFLLRRLRCLCENPRVLASITTGGDPSAFLKTLTGLEFGIVREAEHQAGIREDGTIEPDRLYLDNEYLQYAHALCAAEECRNSPRALRERTPFEDLPYGFGAFLEHELQAEHPAPVEFHQLKQRARAGAHQALGLCAGVEETYEVWSSREPGQRVGALGYSQVLREAYPGAIYRRQGEAYRIMAVEFAPGRISATPGPEASASTRPIFDARVFPRFGAHAFHVLGQSARAFVCECRLQVAEQVTGFVEHTATGSTETCYGAECAFAQQALHRCIDTTGVCFCFDSPELRQPSLAEYLAAAFRKLCPVAETDIGTGLFSAVESPWGYAEIHGFAIYDTAYGSLRLSRHLMERLDQVVAEARRSAREKRDRQAGFSLARLAGQFAHLADRESEPEIFRHLHWLTVIAPNQPALLRCDAEDGTGHEEVRVVGHVLTAEGLRYQLELPGRGIGRQVCSSLIHPIQGLTRLQRYNPDTGEVRECA